MQQQIGTHTYTHNILTAISR